LRQGITAKQYERTTEAYNSSNCGVMTHCVSLFYPFCQDPIYESIESKRIPISFP
jgi:hypothetical protein